MMQHFDVSSCIESRTVHPYQLFIRFTESTLKGNGDGYSLAIWSDDTYSYALSFIPQVAEETVAAIIQAMSAK